MINGIIGRKIGMTQIFAADGTVTPVTVIKAGRASSCRRSLRRALTVITPFSSAWSKTSRSKLKNVTKPMRGHFEKTGGGIPPTRILKEFRLDGRPATTNVGDKVLVDQFADGDVVDVVGKSKGRGFAGTIKRHNFNRGPESHGSMNVRAPGSIGHRPILRELSKARVRRVTWAMRASRSKGLTVATVDAENNLLMIRGAVPGANGSVVVVKKSETVRSDK